MSDRYADWVITLDGPDDGVHTVNLTCYESQLDEKITELLEVGGSSSGCRLVDVPQFDGLVRGDW